MVQFFFKCPVAGYAIIILKVLYEVHDSIVDVAGGDSEHSVLLLAT